MAENKQKTLSQLPLEGGRPKKKDTGKVEFVRVFVVDAAEGAKQIHIV